MIKSITTVPIYFFRVVILVFAIIAYYYIPGLQEFLYEGINYLRHRNFEGLRQLILSYGFWAPFASIALMVVQSLIPFVPGLIITITNAWIFGWQYGALYSWSGALCGAILDFCLARWYGRLAVEKIVNHKYLNITDEFLNKHGLVAVLMTRLTPIIPFKVVSYGAGLTSMSLLRFMSATAIGQAPATILYSILGQNITRNIHITIAITSLFLVIGIIIYCYREKIKQRFFTNEE
ncbi:TVP38/TMEM64 family protein [Pelosinus sp. sgz500959]|uniref:TVP38/TMEM64 family protein n=1 Tax=Pelosinus sp. sgz500959 TaxID=3242472 RepID=UPI00366A9D62